MPSPPFWIQEVTLMLARRTALKSAVGIVAGLLVDPTGWLGSKSVQAALPLGYDEYAGFVLLKPGQPRPPASRQGPAISVVPEPSGGLPPTVATVDLSSLDASERLRGGLGHVAADAAILEELRGYRLIHQETNAVVLDTKVFRHRPTGHSVVLSAVSHVPLPYSVAAAGTPEHGYGTWERVEWLPRPGIAIAPAFTACGLWIDADTLYRLEVVDSELVGPPRVHSVLAPVAVALRHA